MPMKRSDEYIPIKCEGWNGKFVYGSGTANNVSKVRRYNQNITDTSNFYGRSTEPIVLPTVWDGTFVKSGETRIKPERNRSNDAEYFKYNTEPTVLPTTWSGKFQLDPNDIRIKPDRNRSDDSEYFKYNTEPTILPTTWNGQFEVDPNDVRIKPERNHSDVRNYAEENRFKRVN